MKTYTFMEALKELNNSEYEDRAFIGNQIQGVPLDGKVEFRIYRNSEYELGVEKIIDNKTSLSLLVCPSVLLKLNELTFTKILSDNEEFVEKWSEIELNTPIEIRDDNTISLCYFKGINEKRKTIKYSQYLDSKVFETFEDVRLAGDTEFERFNTY